MRCWTDSYLTPSGPRKRRELLLVGATRMDAEKLPARSSPRTLPRGRHRLAREVVDSIQRERIAYATAEVVSDRGGQNVAVAEIVAAAGVSREVFYAHFADKEQAFLATHQLIFEQLMAASSSAFFMPDTPWPQRVWEAGRAFAAVLAGNLSFAHFAFVSAYSIGETGVRRVDETTLAFGLFLEEGYRLSPQAAEIPRLVSDVIALAVVEAAAFHVRNGRTADLPALVPAVTYTAVAPFIGTDAAGELVDDRIQASRRSRTGVEYLNVSPSRSACQRATRSASPRSPARSRVAGSPQCPRRCHRSSRHGASAQPGTRGCTRCRPGSGSRAR